MAPDNLTLSIELPPELLVYLDELVAMRLYGDTREAVCAYLIQRGLDDLLREGILAPIGDFRNSAAGAEKTLALVAGEEPLDPYYYAREPGAWSVRGPAGFQMKSPGLDKNVAYVIAKMLSGQFGEALALLRDLPPLPGDRRFGT